MHFIGWLDFSIGMVFIAFACVVVQSHELCIDGSPPFEPPNNIGICPSYSSQRACCNDDIAANPIEIGFAGKTEKSLLIDKVIEFNGTLNAQCNQRLHELVCASCDAMSAHLFDSGDPIAPFLTYPRMCIDYCVEVYQQCSDLPMNMSPFQTDIDFGSQTIHQIYDSAIRFCSQFSTGSNQGYCYDGLPFFMKLPIDQENVSTNSSIRSLCLERVDDSTNVINLASLPTNQSLVVIGTKSGIVSVHENILGQELRRIEVMLDMSDRVLDAGEMGFLGMAFHPHFIENGKFFASYSCVPRVLHPDTCIEQGANVIEELTFDPSDLSAGVQSSRIVLQLAQPYRNHNGGQIMFSPDCSGNESAFLYAMFGDGGSGGDPQDRAQNKSNWWGSIIRINIDEFDLFTNGYGINQSYTIPNDNPFGDEIYAYGLRNPWRCSMDAERPAAFYCGDVGQNAAEEIDSIVKGGNYGWNRFEGSARYSTLDLTRGELYQQPILQYAHDGSSASICGGYIYRDRVQNPELQGAYIYGDLYGRLWAAVEQDPGNTHSSVSSQLKWECSPSSPLPCDTNGGFWQSLFSFGEDTAHTRQLFLLTGRGVYRALDARICRGEQSVREFALLVESSHRNRNSCVGSSYNVTKIHNKRKRTYQHEKTGRDRYVDVNSSGRNAGHVLYATSISVSMHVVVIMVGVLR